MRRASVAACVAIMSWPVSGQRVEKATRTVRNTDSSGGSVLGVPALARTETQWLRGSATTVFSHVGSDQFYVVPDGVTSIIVKSWGAAGAGSFVGSGGAGGYTTGPLATTPGEILTIVVGGGGRFTAGTFGGSGGYGGGGGGGNGAGGGHGGGGGGGRSAVSRFGSELITVGGGAGASGSTSSNVSGGAGGGIFGQGGASGTTVGSGGFGGTQSGGGAGGAGGGGPGGPFVGGSGGSAAGPGSGGGGGGSSHIPAGGSTLGTASHTAPHQSDPDYPPATAPPVAKPRP